MLKAPFRRLSRKRVQEPEAPLWKVKLTYVPPMKDVRTYNRDRTFTVEQVLRGVPGQGWLVTARAVDERTAKDIVVKAYCLGEIRDHFQWAVMREGLHASNAGV